MKISHTAPRGLAAMTSEAGASLIEYALLVALIAVVCIGAVAFLGNNSSSTMDKGAKATADPASSTTTAPSAGCPSIHPDGYATGPGYGYDCYSPTYGPYDM